MAVCPCPQRVDYQTVKLFRSQKVSEADHLVPAVNGFGVIFDNVCILVEAYPT